MHPNIVLNWPAILTSTVIAFFLGFLWYSVLFVKPWAAAMKMSMDKKPDSKAMFRSLGLQLLGLFLMTYVLAHSSQVWRASVWGVGEDGPDAMYGFYSGFFTWLGFFVPAQLGKIAWEGRPWSLFLINSSHDFVMLQAVTQILCHWR